MRPARSRSTIFIAPNGERLHADRDATDGIRERPGECRALAGGTRESGAEPSDRHRFDAPAQNATGYSFAELGTVISGTVYRDSQS